MESSVTIGVDDEKAREILALQQELQEQTLKIVEESPEEFSQKLFDCVGDFDRLTKDFVETIGSSSTDIDFRESCYLQVCSLCSSLTLHLIGDIYEATPPVSNVEFTSWDDISDASISYLDELLSICRVPNYDRVFVVGSLDKKKTIETQQLRAAAIALALAVKQRGATLDFGIVGGGFAGVTAAATLLRLGHNVHVFESGPRLFNLQWNSTDRFIHPSVYEWPKTDWTVDSFDISGLAWVAEYAGEVSKQVLNSFNIVLAGSVGSYSFEPWVDIHRFKEIGPSTDDRRVEVTERKKRAKFGNFDYVLLCAGFGLEQRLASGIDTPGYWGGVPIPDFEDSSGDRSRRILISGTGDGGLIDLLYASFGGLRHHQILNLVPEVHDAGFRGRFLEIEKGIQEAFVSVGDSVNILDLYRENFSDVDVSGIVDNVHPRRRLTLNSDIEGIFTPQSAPINRLLTFFLDLAGQVNLRVDRVDFSSEAVCEGSRPGSWLVRWNNYDEEEFDRIILRHGVTASFLTDRFGIKEESLTEMRTALSRFDFAKALPDEVREFLIELRKFRVSKRMGA